MPSASRERPRKPLYSKSSPKPRCEKNTRNDIANDPEGESLDKRLEDGIYQSTVSVVYMHTVLWFLLCKWQWQGRSVVQLQQYKGLYTSATSHADANVSWLELFGPECPVAGQQEANDTLTFTVMAHKS